jgi:hypothetical protein
MNAQAQVRTPNLDAALKLAAQGLFVFPAGADKRPLCRWRDVSTNEPSRVAALWNGNPGALPAIDCGKSGLVVIDCDRHGGPDGVAAFERLAHGEVFPATVQTPRNGLHVFFKQPDGQSFGNARGGLPGGVDVRGDGGFVVAPGARLPDGRTYECPDFDASKIPILPDDLAAILRAKPDSKAMAANDDAGHVTRYGEAALRAECAKVAGAANGERNNALNRAAFAIGQLVASGDVDEGLARARLEASAAACGLPSDEALRTIASGVESGKRTPRHVQLKARVERTAGHAGALAFTTFEEACEAPAAKRWLLKGVVAKGETSAWISPPGGGKSALLTEMCVAVASGRDWHGRRNKERCAVVYFALERADLVKRRLAAHRQRDGLEALPIAVVGATINLMEESQTEIVVSTIKAIEERFGMPVGLVVFDTFAKMVAAGGGDEDRAKDQGAILANIGRIKEAVDVHVAIIGHTGKDADKGARGSNAFLGDVDVMVQIRGGLLKTATVTKCNDGPEGPLLQYRMASHALGVDDDGEAIEVGIIDPVQAGQSGTTGEFSQAFPAMSRSARMSAPQRIARDALLDAIVEAGRTEPGNPRVPPGCKTVTEDTWRRFAYARGVSDGTPEAKKKAFQRARAALVAGHSVATWDGIYWLPEGDLSPVSERDKTGQTGTNVPPCPGTHRDIPGHTPLGVSRCPVSLSRLDVPSCPDGVSRLYSPGATQAEGLI